MTLLSINSKPTESNQSVAVFNKESNKVKIRTIKIVGMKLTYQLVAPHKKKKKPRNRPSKEYIIE